MADMIQYLRLPPSSPLYNQLLPVKQDQSLLDQLLIALVHTPHQQHEKTTSTSPHTTPKKPIAMTVGK